MDPLEAKVLIGIYIIIVVGFGIVIKLIPQIREFIRHTKSMSQRKDKK